jgi:hypothetical protein
MDPMATEGMVDEDGEMYSVAMQDMDASCLDSTLSQWTLFLADVDDRGEEEEFYLQCFENCKGGKWPAIKTSGSNLSRTA